MILLYFLDTGSYNQMCETAKHKKFENKLKI